MRIKKITGVTAVIIPMHRFMCLSFITNPDKLHGTITIQPLITTLFGVSNPPGDYSMGHFLTDSLRPLFHLTGTEENYAFVTPEAIYEKKHSGRIVVTDSLLNPIDHPMSPQLLKEVLEYKNRFRKKD